QTTRKPSAGHCVRMPFSVETPVPSGPRKRGQSSPALRVPSGADGLAGGSAAVAAATGATGDAPREQAMGNRQIRAQIPLTPRPPLPQGERGRWLGSPSPLVGEGAGG